MNDPDLDALLLQWARDHEADEANFARTFDAALRSRDELLTARARRPKRVVPRGTPGILGILGDILTSGRGLQWISLGVACVALLISVAQSWRPRARLGDGDSIPRAVHLPSAEAIAREPLIGRAGWRRAGLIIGVGRYDSYHDSKDLPNLPSADEDALRAHDLAERRMMIPQENLFLLRDDQATEAAVRGALLYLRQFRGPQDLVIIHVACHARRDDKGRLQLMLADSRGTGGLPARELLDALKDTQGAVVLVADVCYAGELARDLAPGSPHQWVVASASADEETEGNRFSRQWFRALDDHADVDGAGIITLREAFNWTKEQLSKAGYLRGQLLGPENTDIPLVLRPEVRPLLPLPGPPAALPAELQIKTDSGAAHECWIDGQFLGVISGRRLSVKLPAGKHQVVIRESRQLLAVDRQPRELWRAEVTLESGMTSTHLVQLAAIGAPDLGVGVPDLPVILGEGSGLFPIVERSPSHDSVDLLKTPDGIWKLTFRFREGEGLVGRSSVAFVARPNLEPDIAALLGVPDDAYVQLAFNARTDNPSPVKIAFSGADWPNSTQAQNASLVGNYRAFSLKFPARDLHQLAVGLRLSCEARDNGGQPVTIFIKDVTLRPFASSN